MVARFRFQPVAADSALSSVSLNVLGAVDQQTAEVQGPTVTRTVDITTLAGDANCDGGRDPSDALGIMRYAVGLNVIRQCPLNDPNGQISVAGADIDGDRVVTIADALVVMRCSVGLPEPGICD